MPVTSATCWAEIDLSALHHNVEVLREIAAPADLAAVVKADAYGHGAVDIGQAALQAGAEMLCVFTAREAVELREAGIDGPILCMGPLLPGDHGDHEAAAEYDFAVVVDSSETADALNRHASEQRIRVHINIDSGMQRYGRPHAQAIALAELVRSLDGVELSAAFTHFPDAGNADTDTSLDALRRFLRTADQIGAPVRHAAASAATFNLPKSTLDFVRAGIALYGIDPAPELALPSARRLRPVMSWRTTLLAVRDVAPGESVSYGGLWTAERESRIGVTGVGYADGLLRSQSPGGEMLVRGQRAPIRGAVCMDSAMIDLTNIPDAQVGDAVTIIGADGSQSITAWDLARRSGTIPYEILTGVAARVPRRVAGQAD